MATGTGAGRRALYFMAMAVFVLATFIGDGVRELVFGSGNQLWWGAQIFILVLAAYLFFWVFHASASRAKKILGAKVRTTGVDQRDPVANLIMGYSPLTGEGRKILEGEDLDSFVDDTLIPELRRLGTNAVAATGEIYECAVAAHPEAATYSAIRANKWQQNLRAVWVHGTALKRILVLDPNADQFAALKRYLEAAYAGQAQPPHIERIARPRHSGAEWCWVDEGDGGERVRPDYEDYRYVYEGINRGVEKLARGASLEDVEKQTCVDATSGIKLFSIAASILTLNRNLVFSYVTTKGLSRFYNVSLEIGGGDM